MLIEFGFNDKIPEAKQLELQLTSTVNYIQKSEFLSKVMIELQNSLNQIPSIENKLREQ